MDVNNRVNNKGKAPEQVVYFVNLINKYIQSNYELEEREAALQQRLDLVEASLPAIMLWNMWRIHQNDNITCAEVADALSKTTMGQNKGSRLPQGGRAKSATRQTDRKPTTPNVRQRPDTSPVDPNKYERYGKEAHYSKEASGENTDSRINELEDEIQNIIIEKQKEQAKWLATEEQLRKEIKDMKEGRGLSASALELEESYCNKIKELEEELCILKEQTQGPNASMMYSGSQPEKFGDTFINEGAMDLSDTMEYYNIECIKRLQELVQDEFDTKKRIADLEHKHAVYMETFQQADQVWSNLEDRKNKPEQVEKEKAPDVAQQNADTIYDQSTVDNDIPTTTQISELEHVVEDLNNTVSKIEDEKNEMTDKYEEVSRGLAESEHNVEVISNKVDSLETELSTKNDLLEQESNIVDEKASENTRNVSTTTACECKSLKETVYNLQNEIQELQNQKEIDDKKLLELIDSVNQKEAEIQRLLGGVNRSSGTIDDLARTEVVVDTPLTGAIESPGTTGTFPQIEAEQTEEKQRPVTTEVLVEKAGEVPTTYETDFDEDTDVKISEYVSDRPQDGGEVVAQTEVIVDTPLTEAIESPGTIGTLPQIEAEQIEEKQRPVTTEVLVKKAGEVPQFDHITTCDTDFDEDTDVKISEYVSDRPQDVGEVAVTVVPTEGPQAEAIACILPEGITASDLDKLEDKLPFISTLKSCGTEEVQEILDNLVTSLSSKHVITDDTIEAIVSHVKDCDNCADMVEDTLQTIIDQVQALSNAIVDGVIEEAKDLHEVPPVIDVPGDGAAELEATQIEKQTIIPVEPPVQETSEGEEPVSVELVEPPVQETSEGEEPVSVELVEPPVQETSEGEEPVSVELVEPPVQETSEGEEPVSVELVKPPVQETSEGEEPVSVELVEPPFQETSEGEEPVSVELVEPPVQETSKSEEPVCVDLTGGPVSEPGLGGIQLDEGKSPPASCSILCWEELSDTKQIKPTGPISSDPSCSILCWAETQVRYDGDQHPEIIPKSKVPKEDDLTFGISTKSLSKEKTILSAFGEEPKDGMPLDIVIDSFEYSEDSYSRTTAADFNFGEGGSFRYDPYTEVLFTDSQLDMLCEEDVESVHLGSKERLFMDEFPSIQYGELHESTDVTPIRETAPEEAHTDEVATEELTVQAVLEEAPIEQVLEEKFTDELAIEETIPAEAVYEEAAPQEAPTEQLLEEEHIDDIAPQEEHIDEAAPQEAHTDEVAPQEADTDDTAPQEAHIDEATTDQAHEEEHAGEAASEEASTEQAVFEEAPTDQALIEEHTDDTAPQEAHIDEAATDQVHEEELAGETASEEASTVQAVLEEAPTDQALKEEHTDDTAPQEAHIDEVATDQAHEEELAGETASEEASTVQAVFEEAPTDQALKKEHTDDTAPQEALIDEAATDQAHEEELVVETTSEEASTVQAVFEEGPTDQTLNEEHTDDTEPQEAHIDEAATDQAHEEELAGETASEEASTVQAVFEEAPTDQALKEEHTDDTAPQEALIDEAATDQAHEEELAVETASEEASTVQAVFEEGPTDQTLNEEHTDDTAPQEAHIDEAATDQAHKEELAGETASDEASTVQAVLEEAPTDQALKEKHTDEVATEKALTVQAIPEGPHMRETVQAKLSQEVLAEKAPISGYRPVNVLLGYRIERITSSTSPIACEFSIIRYKDPTIKPEKSAEIIYIEEEISRYEQKSGAQDFQIVNEEQETFANTVGTSAAISHVKDSDIEECNFIPAEPIIQEESDDNYDVSVDVGGEEGHMIENMEREQDGVKYVERTETNSVLYDSNTEDKEHPDEIESENVFDVEEINDEDMPEDECEVSIEDEISGHEKKTIKLLEKEPGETQEVVGEDYGQFSKEPDIEESIVPTEAWNTCNEYQRDEDVHQGENNVTDDDNVMSSEEQEDVIGGEQELTDENIESSEEPEIMGTESLRPETTYAGNDTEGQIDDVIESEPEVIYENGLESSEEPEIEDEVVGTKSLGPETTYAGDDTEGQIDDVIESEPEVIYENGLESSEEPEIEDEVVGTKSLGPETTYAGDDTEGQIDDVIESEPEVIYENGLESSEEPEIEDEVVGTKSLGPETTYAGDDTEGQIDDVIESEPEVIYENGLESSEEPEIEDEVVGTKSLGPETTDAGDDTEGQIDDVIESEPEVIYENGLESSEEPEIEDEVVGTKSLGLETTDAGDDIEGQIDEDVIESEPEVIDENGLESSEEPETEDEGVGTKSFGQEDIDDDIDGQRNEVLNEENNYQLFDMPDSENQEENDGGMSVERPFVDEMASQEEIEYDLVEHLPYIESSGEPQSEVTESRVSKETVVNRYYEELNPQLMQEISRLQDRMKKKSQEYIDLKTIVMSLAGKSLAQPQTEVNVEVPMVPCVPPTNHITSKRPASDYAICGKRPLASTVSEFESAIESLQTKCKMKDHMIQSLIEELRQREQGSGVWRRLLENISSDPICEPNNDYNRTNISRALPRPELNPAIQQPPVVEESKDPTTITRRCHCKPHTSPRAEPKSPSPKSSPKSSQEPSERMCECPSDFKIVRRVGHDSLLVSWSKPSNRVIGYEIYVNGTLYHQVRSSTRNKAVLQCLDLRNLVVILLYAVTRMGRCPVPVTVTYQEQQNKSCECHN